MQNMHVNCKQIFPWTINNVIICRTNAISYYKCIEYAGIRQKNMLMISKKNIWPLKLTEYAENRQYRHLPIQERLVYSHLICMCMIVNVHICSIYSAYIYIPRSQVCFLLRCLPTNQVLCVKDCLLTKSSVIWKRVMFWKWPTVTILIWSIPGVLHVISWVPILSSRVVNPFPESSNL